MDKDKIFLLTGEKIDYEKEIIETRNNEMVFVFKSDVTELFSYIDYLHEEKEVSNKIIHRMKICKYIDFNENVSLYNDSNNSEIMNIKDIVALLKEIEKGNFYTVVVENNDRNLLASILQQLIYIDYPVTEINLKLRSEYKDAVKSANFMRRIDELYETSKEAYEFVDKLSIQETANNDNIKEIKEKTRNAYVEISEQINKAKDVEIKVAVAASKKTGKSVIVNSMIGEQIAPTSLTLPTPNTCKYKRSSDKNYHLYDGKETTDYSSRKEIYHKLDRAFKEAQKTVGFTIPDMEISYVSNGNNFEAYTIFDTPGPDFACQRISEEKGGHELSAYNSIDECDVAIFAIDYSKHLQTNEEEYLKAIKSIFEKKHKFHTLIFVINKIDLALADKGTNSKARIIDYIHYCLKKVDVAYSDCVIFTTSAQDYFYSLELIEEAKKNPEIKKLIDNNSDLFVNLPKIIAEMDDNTDDDYSRILSYVNGEVGKIKTQLGYKTIDLKTFQEYSGIPQLLSYVSYIAKSKARDEIVNSITYSIDNQYNTIKTVIDKLANIKELMEKTENDIEKISNILEEYSRKTRAILCKDIDLDDDSVYVGNSDLECCTAFLKNTYSRYGNEIKKDLTFSNEEKLKVVDIVDRSYRDIKDINDIFILDDLWSSVRNAQIQKINKCRGKKATRDEIELSHDEISENVESHLMSFIKEEKERCVKNIIGLKEDMISILNHRDELIKEKTKECQIKLEKEDVTLIFPQLPVFDVAIDCENWSKATFNFDSKVDINIVKGEFKKVGKVKQFFRNIKKWDFDRKEYKVPKKMTDDDVKKVADLLKDPFKDAVKNSSIHKEVLSQLETMTNEASKQSDSLISEFKKQNKTCNDNVNIFMSVLDDRNRYKDNLDELEYAEKVIHEIESASEQFFKIWSEVILE